MIQPDRPSPRNGALAAPLLVFALSLVAVLRWHAAHPLPIYWDEANYANFAIADHRFFQSGGVVRVVKALLFEDPARPPAYRAMALPVTMFVEPTVGLLRGIALAWSAVAAFLLFIAWRRVTSTFAAAMLAAMAFAAPAVIQSAGWFATEFALFVAIGLLMVALIPRPSFFPLAAAIALGLLSKTTFVAIGFPALAVAAWFAWRSRERRDLVTLIGGSIAGAVIASGWWIWHLREALEYAAYGRNFQRVLTGSFANRLRVLFSDGLGIPLSIALVLLIVAAVRLPAPRARWIAAAGAVPLIVIGFLSPTFVARHIAGTLLLVPFVLAVAAFEKRSRLVLAAVALIVVQAVILAAAPLRMLPHVDQTDWSVLRPLIPGDKPAITFLGGGSSLSPPELRYAWMSRGADANVTWLWRFEEGAIDWNRVVQRASASDAVLVVSPDSPAGDANDVRDNVHNRELIARLRQLPQFAPPVQVPIGTRKRAELLVFVKRPG